MPGFPGMIAVSTNHSISKSGALVMGRGAALQAKQRIPGIDLECGEAIRSFQQRCDGPYGFLVVRPPTDSKIGFGIFQVKYHWAEAAALELIWYSAEGLAKWAKDHSDCAIRMNFPGIGNGHLSRQEVLPIIQDVLPQNVAVCHR